MLVVDDSVVVRRLVTDALAGDPEIEVVGTAANGRVALAKIAQLKPDVVTMDIEMPEMDGIEAVRELRRTAPALPVIMFCTLTERGAAATLDALAAGASDYVTKPSNVGGFAESHGTSASSYPQDQGAAPATRRRGAAAGGPCRRRPPGPWPAGPRTGPRPACVVAIGSSTGGPDALATVLPALPADLPVPVVVVQHMPPVFTRLLAAASRPPARTLRVVEAERRRPRCCPAACSSRPATVT